MDQSGLVPVRVRACECPDAIHPDGDAVYLLPSLSLEGGAAAELDREIVMDGFEASTEKTRLTTALLARWTSTYVRYGAVGWNFERLDEHGRREPIPFDVEALVSNYRLSKLVAAKANDLYSEDILGPLLEAAKAAELNRAQRRSRTGQTGSSTSRKRSTSKPPASSSDEPSDGPALRIAR